METPGSAGYALSAILVMEARLETSRGSLALRTGEPEQAVEHYRRALAIYREQLGGQHPLVTRALNNVGIAYHHAGDHAAAIDHHRQAVQAKLELLGPGAIRRSRRRTTTSARPIAWPESPTARRSSTGRRSRSWRRCCRRITPISSFHTTTSARST